MFPETALVTVSAGGIGRAIVEQLEREEACRRVYAILDRLPEKQRRVLILFEIEGMSTAEMAELIPGAKLVIMKDASHFAMWQKPDEFNATVLEFLAGKP